MSRTHRKHTPGKRDYAPSWMWRRQSVDDLIQARREELMQDMAEHAYGGLHAPLNDPIPGVDEEEEVVSSD